MQYNPIKSGDAFEWLGMLIISGAVGWVTEPKWGVLLFAIYVGIVFISVAWQVHRL